MHYYLSSGRNPGATGFESRKKEARDGERREAETVEGYKEGINSENDMDSKGKAKN